MLMRLGPTSGSEPRDSVQIYGLEGDIHIIHNPYYYYESHILLNNYPEYLLHRPPKGFGEIPYIDKG